MDSALGQNLFSRAVAVTPHLYHSLGKFGFIYNRNGSRCSHFVGHTISPRTLCAARTEIAVQTARTWKVSYFLSMQTYLIFLPILTGAVVKVQVWGTFPLLIHSGCTLKTESIILIVLNLRKSKTILGFEI